MRLEALAAGRRRPERDRDRRWDCAGAMTGWCSTPWGSSPPWRRTAPPRSPGRRARRDLPREPRAGGITAMCVDLAAELDDRPRRAERRRLPERAPAGTGRGSAPASRPAGLREPRGARQRRRHQPRTGARRGLTRPGGAPDMIGQVEHARGLAFLERRASSRPTQPSRRGLLHRARRHRSPPARRRWRIASSPGRPCSSSAPDRMPPTRSTIPSSSCIPSFPAAARCPPCRSATTSRPSPGCSRERAPLEVFAHQLRVLGRPGDIALAFAHAPAPRVDRPRAARRARPAACSPWR